MIRDGWCHGSYKYGCTMNILLHQTILHTNTNTNTKSSSQHQSTMRTFLIFALLALAASTTIAQLETRCSQGMPQEKPWSVQPEQPCPHQQQDERQLQQGREEEVASVWWRQQQQLYPCQDFLLQGCAAAPFQLRSQILQQSSCRALQEQCCQQLALIPVQSRKQAIYQAVQAVFKQQLGQGQQGSLLYPQQQEQTLSTMCNNVYGPPYSPVTTSPFGVGAGH